MQINPSIQSTHHPLAQLLKVFKLKVVLVMLFSAAIGMLVAPQHQLTGLKMISGLTGIGIAACASAALNHRFDMHEDKKMARTKQRPLAMNHINPTLVEKIAVIGILFSLLLLASLNNLLCAMLTFATTVGYSVIYTKWLKPSTPQNIVIGGLSGAMPPLLGWTCITGEIAVKPLLLVLIIFTWTPAHFWPLALQNQQDYAKTKWPMLPVTHGRRFTQLSIMAYALLTAAASLLPFCIRMTGSIYLVIACMLNARWIFLCYRLWQDARRTSDVFQFSIQYILILFCALVIDQT